MKITEAGVFPIGQGSNSRLSILVSGVFGGAAVEVGYLTEYNDLTSFVGVADGVFVDAFQTEYGKGQGTQAALSITGGAGIALDVLANPVT